MSIFIFHHHLNPGGVTRIIYSQVEALKGEDVTVYTGATDGTGRIEKMGAKLIVKEDLNYLKNQLYEPIYLHNLLRDYLWFLKETVTKQDILHIHNLNLGKNPVLTFAFYLLAKEGYQVFNHAHDFAEDRPLNYDFLQRVIEKHFEENLQEVLYPSWNNYRYAVLNSRDYERLIHQGINKGRVSWLPNPVSLGFNTDNFLVQETKQKIQQELQLQSEKNIVTYPVRVIQRKNIGEFILLSVLFADTAEFLVTQPPQNPSEIIFYKKWLDFCQQQNIRVHFEVGNKVDFLELLIATDFCITTSYMEGFGMAYLEPWLLKKPVVGRDITYITKDFREDNMLFAALYEQLSVNGKDFAMLEMWDQMQCILEVITDEAAKQKIWDENKSLATLFEPMGKGVIEKNRSIIINKYSLEGYGIQLKSEYQKFSR